MCSPNLSAGRDMIEMIWIYPAAKGLLKSHGVGMGGEYEQMHLGKSKLQRKERFPQYQTARY